MELVNCNTSGDDVAHGFILFRIIEMLESVSVSWSLITSANLDASSRVDRLNVALSGLLVRLGSVDAAHAASRYSQQSSSSPKESNKNAPVYSHMNEVLSISW